MTDYAVILVSTPFKHSLNSASEPATGYFRRWFKREREPEALADYNSSEEKLIQRFTKEEIMLLPAKHRLAAMSEAGL